MLDRAMNIALTIGLVIVMTAVLVLAIKNMQLGAELSEANTTIVTQSESIKALKVAIKIQNDSIDEFAAAGDEAIGESEQALAEAKPVIQEEERRILGIRSAQQSSASDDSAVRLEDIRQKMLGDALL